MKILLGILWALVSAAFFCGVSLAQTTNVAPPAQAAPLVVSGSRPDNVDDVRKAAEAGNAQAMVSLGLRYLFGKGVPVNAVEAAKWLRKAADLGRADGQDFLGRCYYKGSGVPKDLTEADKWFRKAADQGLGAAEDDLGQSYYFGDGVEQDSVKAFEWYSKAAAQGQPEAQCSLGCLYALGNGVKQDYVEADKWLLKAADQGNPEAQVCLAYSYKKGLGVQVDRAEALKWYTSAAEQGSPEGQLDLGTFYFEDAPTAPFFYPVAVKWFQKAADQGNARAQYNLGYCYWKGTGIAQDSNEAARWYQKAADQGYPEALYALGTLYFNGDGVSKDHSVTVKLDLKAAQLGLVPAEFGLGNLYLNGDGVPKDEIEALAWLDIAAASGDQQSLDLRHWLEEKVGEQYTIEAEQRSKELLKQVNPGTEEKSGTTQNPPPKAQSDLSNSEPDGYGSGVFVSADGLVLTAAHVIKDAAVVKVRTPGGLKTAQVLSIDAADDVALLKCEGKFQPVPVKDSTGVKLGQSVFTIGFPDPLLQGFSPKMTRGEISSLMGVEDDPHDWQISVPVQPGNSGGPLFDEAGNAVGLVVAKLKPTVANDAVGAAPENVNYAVKSSYALSLLSSYSSGLLPEVATPKIPENLEDIVARVQNSVVLILVYSSGNPSVSSGQTSPDQKPVPISHTYKDSSGREYWVSDADYIRLLPIKQALDMESKQLDEMLAQLDIQDNKINSVRAALDNTDPQAVANFNAEVDSYNSYKVHIDQKTDEFNTSVDNFNRELQRVGRLNK